MDEMDGLVHRIYVYIFLSCYLIVLRFATQHTCGIAHVIEVRSGILASSVFTFMGNKKWIGPSLAAVLNVTKSKVVFLPLSLSIYFLFYPLP